MRYDARPRDASFAALASAGPFESKINASRMVVLPGLVDCHAHAGHGLLKTLGADDGDRKGRDSPRNGCLSDSVYECPAKAFQVAAERSAT